MPDDKANLPPTRGGVAASTCGERISHAARANIQHARGLISKSRRPARDRLLGRCRLGSRS